MARGRRPLRAVAGNTGVPSSPNVVFYSPGLDLGTREHLFLAVLKQFVVDAA
ncbi:hypothetical protein [Brevundimonas sp. NIBR11]|uniref:hypothetical protein n=1 Tax=Brevundimonas sp. NIBR11 TaxID=3015999 RepID=UPI0022F0DF3E|nr:hypothetical protein [Brevundimonas sp. NIBR11]